MQLLDGARSPSPLPGAHDVVGVAQARAADPALPLEERLDALNARFHLQRQTAITTELLDIVSGYEALTGRS